MMTKETANIRIQTIAESSKRVSSSFKVEPVKVKAEFKPTITKETVNIRIQTFSESSKRVWSSFKVKPT